MNLRSENCFSGLRCCELANEMSISAAKTNRDSKARLGIEGQ
jgi:hypothetical protein